ncbi:T9SS type A sorting domain-containing protein [Dokdonia sp.]|uniref:T9SS type A sorting domain-containing protein n=1 Tax=Dokdonia sp. TaxID=2024995 RepID=UPI003267640F
MKKYYILIIALLWGITTVMGQTRPISGTIAIPCNNLPIEGVEVTIVDVNGAILFTEQTTTDANGNYSFPAVPYGANYTITAHKTEECQSQIACGLDDDDVNQIRRHLLGVELLDNPLNLIAADVNDDESISGLDINIIARIILGINGENDPIGEIWNFVVPNYPFIDPADPFGELAMASVIMIDDTSGQSNHDFDAVKMGDVNCSYTGCDETYIEMVKLWDDSYQNPSGTSVGNYTDYTNPCIPIFDIDHQQINYSASHGNVYMAFYIDTDEDGVFEEISNGFDDNGHSAVTLTSMISGGEKIRIIVSENPITGYDEIPICGEREDYMLCDPLCEPIPTAIIVNNVNITNDLTYTLPCNTECFIIDPMNVSDPVYNITVPINGNSSIDGQFCIIDGTPDSFTVEIIGKDSCEEPYEKTITINVEQDCEECELEALASVSSCSDNGTPLDPSDDFYSIALDVFNTQGEPWMVLNSQGSIIYFGNGDENNVNVGNYLVADQSEWFWVKLSNDPDCFVDVAVLAPESCNFSCNISAVVSTGDCNDNGTPGDPSDDYYFMTVSVLGTNGVSWDLVGYPGNQPISYSGTGNTTNIQLGPINANDASWVMYISPTGLVDPSCKRYETTIFAPKCSDDRPKDRDGGKVSITPNPNKGKMDIEVDLDTDSVIELNIYRINGTLVKTIKKEKTNNKMLAFGLELDLPTGLYLFSFTTDKEIITKRVIIERN